MPFINRFLVGCDPEFALVGDRPARPCACGDEDCDEYVHASGIGAMFIDEDILEHEGELGTDHGGNCIEVRPKPQRSTYLLTKNIGHILHVAQTRYKLPEGRWRAGALIEAGDDDEEDVQPLGGHVHLDVPFDAPDAADRLNALDAFTRTVEELDILPKNECNRRREVSENNDANHRYGRYSDARVANAANRLEYRTMASWLFHPTPTFLCLTGAKLAAASPQLTLEILKGVDPKAEFRAFFERFAPLDLNAQRAVEKILGRGRKLQHDPNVDLRKSWQVIPF